jgi:hypothetical protein
MRKIIQIAIDPAVDEEDATNVYALCDDGKVLVGNNWHDGHFGRFRWKRELPEPVVEVE